MSRYGSLVLGAIVVSLMSLIILSGCSSSGISGGIGTARPAKLTKEQKAQLTNKLSVKFITRYPNEHGLVRFFGEITNGTDRNLISATIVASDVRTKGKNIVFGKASINDVKPGETREFEIASGSTLDQVGDQAALIVTDAEFQ